MIENFFPKAYVISLDFRSDRRNKIIEEFAKLGLDITFVISCKSENSKYMALTNTTQTEVAIWASHVKAYEIFLESNRKWALILEDDAQISLELKNELILLLKNLDFLIPDEINLVQLGWIPNSKRYGITGIIAQISAYLIGMNRFDLRSLIKLINIHGIIAYRILMKKMKQVTGSQVLPLQGMRLGTHCYLISRSGAQSMIEIFHSRAEILDFMTIDQYLLRVGLNQNPDSELKALRFNKNFVIQPQTDSDNSEKTVI